MKNLLFQQLFESESSTFTYLLADATTREAVIIDPVLETVSRDLKLIGELDLKLLFVLETHVHADHITSARQIADATGARIALSAEAPIEEPHRALRDGDVIEFGEFRLKALATPGHTNSCMCFLLPDRVFTGDTLLIRANGRTDFQEGSAQKLYESVHRQLFTLPDDTLVYPAHDYKGFTSSSIGMEKKFNARLNERRSLEDFVEIMKNLNLPRPKKIDLAVPANLKLGRL
ncbi:MAG: MBL fold metallo-hydrolase [Bdellovibrionaceae bacterium]|nr:MBL fold metallo-hydrolase [Pseudobdellovibrionaceae bacterium]MBX3033849.1 MBL fold metallo-hydrolase [Pseudobdellovibrionaceae bacterium]